MPFYLRPKNSTYSRCGKRGRGKNSGKTGDVIYGQPLKYLDDVNVS